MLTDKASDSGNGLHIVFDIRKLSRRPERKRVEVGNSSLLAQVARIVCRRWADLHSVGQNFEITASYIIDHGRDSNISGYGVIILPYLVKVYNKVVEKGVGLWLACDVTLLKCSERDEVISVHKGVQRGSDPREDLICTGMSQEYHIEEG